MMKLLPLFTLLSFFIIENPIDDLKVSVPPTKEEAQKLNHSNEEFEVYINSDNRINYRYYGRKKVNNSELPFRIIPKKNDNDEFRGIQVNHKVENGWLISFNRGTLGGNLFWFNEEGTKYKKITSGNIMKLLEINGKIYLIKGPTILTTSNGQIFQIDCKKNKYTLKKKVDLPTAPYAITLTKDNEFLIVTSKSLLKVNKNFKIETLIEEGFWWIYLYPNSIVIKDQYIYIGMRGGVLKTQMNNITNQQWLTKK